MPSVTDAPGDGAAAVPLPSPTLTALSLQTPQNGLSPSFIPPSLSSSLVSSHHQQGSDSYSNNSHSTANSNGNGNGSGKGKKKNKRNSIPTGIPSPNIALSPRPLQDLLTERAYLVNSLSAQGQRSCELIQRLAVAEQARQAGDANGNSNIGISNNTNTNNNHHNNAGNNVGHNAGTNLGGQRRRLRKQISLLRSKVAVAGEQEKAIIVRLGELYVEMQSRMRWAQVRMSTQLQPQQQQQHLQGHPQPQAHQYPQAPLSPHPNQQLFCSPMQLDSMIAGVHGSYFPQMPEGLGVGGSYGDGDVPQSPAGSAFSCGSNPSSVNISTGLSPTSPAFVPSSPGWPTLALEGPGSNNLPVPDTLEPPETLALRVPCIVRSEMAA